MAETWSPRGEFLIDEWMRYGGDVAGQCRLLNYIILLLNCGWVLSYLKSSNGCSLFCFTIVATGGLIPGSLTPPDKVVGAGDLAGHLLGQQQQQQHLHHQQQQQQHQQQQSQQQQQHHNHYALALPAGSAMAPTLQTPPSPLSTPSPPVPIDRFGYV